MYYRDRTFCVNNDCKKKDECSRYLTKEHEKDAGKLGMLIAVAHYNCEKEEDVKEMS